MELATAANRLEDDTSAAGFVKAATNILVESGLEDAELFAVDHEFLHLVSLSSSEVVDMNDDIMASLTASSMRSDDSMHWLALPTRQEPLLVARTRTPTKSFDRSIGALLGEVYAQRRTQRFDLERPRRRARMSLAAELQWSLLPQMTDANGHVALAAALRPAYEVAGDAFDYQIDEGVVCAYALDAMGHGTTATLSASLAVTAIRTTRYQGGGLVDQLEAAHEAVFSEWGGDRFVTAVAVESSASHLSVVNAGHEPLRRRSVDGTISTLRLPADPPMGVPHSVSYSKVDLDPLASGEGLALLSDGAPNNRSNNGASLGAEGVNEALKACWSTTPFETVHRFLIQVNDHLDNDDVDDVTALVMVAQ